MVLRTLSSPSLLRRVSIYVDRVEWHAFKVRILSEASVLGFADTLAVCMRFSSLAMCPVIVAFNGRAIAYIEVIEHGDVRDYGHAWRVGTLRHEPNHAAIPENYSCEGKSTSYSYLFKSEVGIRYLGVQLTRFIE